MFMKDKIKNIIEYYNPLVRRHKRILKSRLKNQNITFLCPNCIGGILFHDLGLRFMSPTVNLMMTQTDFIKFVLNLDDYLEKELLFFDDSEYTCPCAMLGDVIIHFTHYHSKEEASIKWNSRAKRINKENLFIFCEERDGITEDEIKSLYTIDARGIVVFTANEYADIPYAVYISKYHKEGEIGNILTKNHIDGSREYELYFDFVRWFNCANGNYDVSDYIL